MSSAEFAHSVVRLNSRRDTTISLAKIKDKTGSAVKECSRVEVLRPSQPIRVMSSRSLYQTAFFLGRFSQTDNFCQNLTTALLESAEGGEWPQKIFCDHALLKNVARSSGDWTWDLLITSRTHIQLSHEGWSIMWYKVLWAWTQIKLRTVHDYSVIRTCCLSIYIMNHKWSINNITFSVTSHLASTLTREINSLHAG